MKKVTGKKGNELFFKCDCGCGQQMLVIEVGDGRCEINTRVDGRRKWTGVVLSKEDGNKFIMFLKKISSA